MHRRCRQAALVVAALAFVVFLPTVLDGFIYDDVQLISKNEYVHALKWLPRAFATHLWDVSPLAVADDINGAVETSRRYYRPIVTVSFLLTWVVAGARAWVYHLTNVVLHAVTAGLATRAAIRWTRSLVLGTVVGVLFAIHPTRSENVTWISGRMDVLMLLFVLLSIEAFDRFERVRSWLWFGLGMGSLAVAILSKEPAVMTPLLLLARDGRRRSWSVLGAAGGLALAYGVGRTLFWRPEGDLVVHTFTPLHFVYTVGSYAHRVIAPWPPAMFYDQVPYEGGKPVYDWPVFALGAVVVIVSLVALVIAWRRSKTAFWLFVAAGAFMGPLLNLFYNATLDVAQDRFLYAPLLFAAAGGACLARPMLRRIVRRRVFVLAGAGAALAAIGVIELRALDYRTDETFWNAELAQSPRDPSVLQMVGRLAAARGDLKGALEYYQRAARPDINRYQRRRPFIRAHLEEASIVGALLPDGRVEELRLLTDELWRTLEPSAPSPPPTSVEGLTLGIPIPDDLLREHYECTTFNWEAALLATRIGDFRRAEKAVRSVNPSRTAPHPLNGVLVLARLDHMAEARSLAAKVDERATFEDLTGHGDFEALSKRLNRAEQMAVARDASATATERAAFEALRLAELGAYWASFRVVVQSSLLDVPETAMLTVQLLVACRFDDAARAYAVDKLGGDRTALVARVEAELPPVLKEVPALSTTLDQVIALARRPP